MRANSTDNRTTNSDEPRGKRSRTRRTGRLLLAAAVVVGLLAAAAAPATAAQDDDAPQQALVVDLHGDGSAEVTLTLTYDLTDENQSESFESLRGDQEARTEYRDRFRDRMQSVASDAESETGREMRVRDAAVSLSTTDDGDTGVVRLSVTYEGLAASEDGRLVVTEPFASGYVTNHAFALRAPEGHELANVSPSPASQTETTVVWDANSDLSGFEAAFEPASAATTTADTESDESGGSAPGIGVLGALAALGATAVVASTRR